MVQKPLDEILQINLLVQTAQVGLTPSLVPFQNSQRHSAVCQIVIPFIQSVASKTGVVLRKREGMDADFVAAPPKNGELANSRDFSRELTHNRDFSRDSSIISQLCGM